MRRNIENNKEKIIEQFHYFNINSEIDSVFGDWAVSKEGDIVNILYPYVIFSFLLNEKDWKVEVESEVWFKLEYTNSLILALDRAKDIILKK